MIKRISIALLFMLPAKAIALDGDHYLNLATCISYASIKGDIGNKKPIPRDYAITISTLTEEYMFEAEVLGFDDNQAHTFIVNELMRQNRIKEEKGIETLTKEVGPTCKALARLFTGG